MVKWKGDFPKSRPELRPGDVDGDQDVDIFDIVKIAGIYGALQGDPSYDANSDIDGDGDIDIFDIVAAAGHYSESWY